MLAETIGQAAADAASSAIGTNVDLGIATSGDPEEMVIGRPVPLRAIIVTYHRPLRDVMVFITSLKEEAVRPVIEAVATATITALDLPTSPDQHGPLGQFSIADAVEYETSEEALEQVDALYLEATYGLELPTGEVQMVLGTGLLESAACFVHGIADPFATEAGFLPAGVELELGDSIGLSEDERRLELGDGQIGELADGALAFGGAGAATSGGVEEFDAMLAAQERAEADAVAAIAAQHAATARANVAAAELPSFAEQTPTGRWTELLSGVEVELSAELGRADLALRDITNLAAESVLTLDQMVNEPVSVYVNGTRYATARLVVVDGEYGIEILEVVEQQEFLPATLAA
ncbi:MAG: flagellar motor switch protein FliN [Thermoleophilia bacterium]|nr:flagellar motor switch protein FliN [Thermoleophilia bacterium]